MVESIQKLGRGTKDTSNNPQGYQIKLNYSDRKSDRYRCAIYIIDIGLSELDKFSLVEVSASCVIDIQRGVLFTHSSIPTVVRLEAEMAYRKLTNRQIIW